jgi:RND family efflux transporter MFP subunit
MSLGSMATKIATYSVIAAGVALTWPDYVEKLYPGFTKQTEAVRAKLPWAGHKPEGGPQAGGPGGRPNVANRPPVPVDIDTVQRGPMPYRVDAVGTVQPIASVAIKVRADAQVEKIFARDGAAVKQGDILVQLDARQINAQIKQTEANILKDKSVLEGAERDLKRTQDLLSRGAGTQLAFDNARTAFNTAKALLGADEALLENQKVQQTWYTLSAPISGRIGTFGAKPGNILRAGDNTATGVLATIVQTTPIYVSFSIPQASLAEVREALERGEGVVTATPQGGTKTVTGKISVIDNTVDAATGTISLKGEFVNADEILWPGQLCNVRVTLRTEPEVVTIPRIATQSGQIGNFVYVVENGVARVRPIKVGRFQDGRDVILDGLKGGETIVSDGGLLLADGIRVDIKNKGQQDQRRAQAESGDANRGHN